MRIETSELLRCPNTSSTDFSCFGAVVKRDASEVQGVAHDSLKSTDDIIDGLLIVNDGDYVYPIREGVLCILADSSVDLAAWKDHFQTIRESCSEPLQAAIDRTVERFSREDADTDGEWNRDEMRY